MVDSVAGEIGEPAKTLVSAPAALPHVPMRFSQKTLYATGDIVDGLINWGTVTFSFYYLNAVVGLSGTEAGMVLLISTLLDAVLDPYIGSLSDNTRSRIGRRLPYMIGAALPISLSFGLLFSIPDVPHGPGLLIYVTGLYLVLRIGLSTFGLPYGALGAELTTDYNERSVFFAFRWVFNCSGNVILLILAFLVFLPGQESLNDREAYVGFGWSCALVALMAMATCCYAGLKMQDRVRVVTQKLNPGGTRFFHEAFEVISNRSFWVLFLCLLLFWTGQGVFNVLGIHVNLYFWKLPDEWIRLLPFIGLVGYFAGIPVSTIVLKYFEKRDVLAAGLMIATVTQLLPAPLALAGLLPQGTTLYLTLGVAGALGAVAASVALIAWGSMMADAADEHEHLFGARREGLYFSGLTLSQKSAAGLGGLVGGMALDGIGFPRDVAAVGVENISADTILNLGIVQGPLAALLSIVGVTILLGYRLNRREIVRIQSDLAVRTQAGKIESQLE